MRVSSALQFRAGRRPRLSPVGGNREEYGSTETGGGVGWAGLLTPAPHRLLATPTDPLGRSDHFAISGQSGLRDTHRSEEREACYCNASGCYIGGRRCAQRGTTPPENRSSLRRSLCLRVSEARSLPSSRHVTAVLVPPPIGSPAGTRGYGRSRATHRTRRHRPGPRRGMPGRRGSRGRPRRSRGRTACPRSAPARHAPPPR